VHITALVESLDHVCCRYLLAAFAPSLKAAGHHLEIRPRPRHWWNWFGLGRALRHADAVLLQRKLLPRWQLGLLRRAARRLLFDLDDAVFLRDSYAGRGLHSAGRLRRFTAAVRAADLVIAGNAFLAEHAARCAGHDRVCVIPTCVQPARYPLAEHAGLAPEDFGFDEEPPPVPRKRKRSAPRQLGQAGVYLVWVGSSSTLQGLEAIRPLLEDVGKKLPGLRLKLICDRFFALANMPVVPCPWTEADEAAEIAAADVGISWVPDDDWSRGKCGLKVLQYMAAGLPVVANPVGVHTEMVRHGENGFLARTPAEWLEAIAELAGNPALRRCMGEEGRRRVEQDYSVAAGAARWRTLLRQLDSLRGAA
jgi:glycosyltransferase involved in cell wall biosynthesis